MSNAMSRSKSRWKGAMLAGAAMTVITPLAANAQFSVGITADPLGGTTSPNAYARYNAGANGAVGPTSNVYIDPYDPVTLYVYGTVTGSQAPSASYVDGLAFTYFNINGATAGVSGLGTFTAITPTTTFNAGDNATDAPSVTPQTGNGVQAGAVSAISGTSSVVIGSTTNVTQVGKVRASNNFYWSSNTGSGANVVVNGNSVSFLLETLTYTPNSASVVANPSAPGAVNSVAFNVSIPSALIASAGDIASNYFVGLPSVPTLGTVVGASNTSTNVTAATTGVTLNEALVGDQNLNGAVDSNDFSLFGPNYNQKISGWTNGDFNNDGSVDSNDFSIFGPNYNKTLVPTSGGSAGVVGPIASLASLEATLGSSSVPEPSSLGLLALTGASLLRRRRVSNAK